MKRFALLFFITSMIVTISFGYSIPCYADKFYVHDGDFVDFGFQLYVSGEIVITIGESNPIKVNFFPEEVNPPGLYDDLLGIRNGQIQNNIIVEPAEGYSASDGTFSAYANQTLTYYNLRVYEINGYHYSDLPTNTGEPTPFGKTMIIIAEVVGGIAAVTLLSYGGYKLYPKVLGKRCSTCRTLGIGSCKKCGAVYCEKCFSNGCPACKGRSLIRFK